MFQRKSQFNQCPFISVVKIPIDPNFALLAPNLVGNSNLNSVSEFNPGTESYRRTVFTSLVIKPQCGELCSFLTQNSNSPYPKPPSPTFLGPEGHCEAFSGPNRFFGSDRITVPAKKRFGPQKFPTMASGTQKRSKSGSRVR